MVDILSRVSNTVNGNNSTSQVITYLTKCLKREIAQDFAPTSLRGHFLDMIVIRGRTTASGGHMIMRGLKRLLKKVVVKSFNWA